MHTNSIASTAQSDRLHSGVVTNSALLSEPSSHAHLLTAGAAPRGRRRPRLRHRHRHQDRRPSPASPTPTQQSRTPLGGSWLVVAARPVVRTRSTAVPAGWPSDRVRWRRRRPCCCPAVRRGDVCGSPAQLASPVGVVALSRLWQLVVAMFGRHECSLGVAPGECWRTDWRAFG